MSVSLATTNTVMATALPVFGRQQPTRKTDFKPLIQNPIQNPTSPKLIQTTAYRSSKKNQALESIKKVGAAVVVMGILLGGCVGLIHRAATPPPTPCSDEVETPWLTPTPIRDELPDYKTIRCQLTTSDPDVLGGHTDYIAWNEGDQRLEVRRITYNVHKGLPYFFQTEKVTPIKAGERLAGGVYVDKNQIHFPNGKVMDGPSGQWV